jgi:hypothetical protein
VLLAQSQPAARSQPRRGTAIIITTIIIATTAIIIRTIIIATMPTILATIIITTGIATKRNFEGPPRAAFFHVIDFAANRRPGSSSK